VTYSVEGAFETLLELQLDFTEPLLVSPNFERDVLQVDFSGLEIRKLLYSPANERYLHENYLVLSS